ncbi:carboxymuconolactone decarboxylase family protein [Dyadobacter sp. CY261]|uniref:carboxymuconolactone decarboxylase family protein n=1 Tax=Dyadobacter sp. CY261 TaxID=2907203 RepID=UPI001F3E2631|nr:carboxymuconolactone decarboxylase family protein [Dyadobacter sp. CY261]MCF0074063.1 carboxymuconolactone decarboxylase family protein [Dyadobacter sp. CY261]
METRLNFFEKGQNALKPLFNMAGYIKKSTIDRQLVELVDFRVSQINQCAYCLDMHSKELRAMGETEQRLYGVSAWREAPYYTDRERAAFAWAEAVTATHITDEVYREVAAQFSNEELVDLTMVVTAINTWNRINIAFPGGIGTYQVGQFG